MKNSPIFVLFHRPIRLLITKRTIIIIKFFIFNNRDISHSYNWNVLKYIFKYNSYNICTPAVIARLPGKPVLMTDRPTNL